MMRWILAAVALLTCIPALAGPVLDPVTHPYIALVTTDKATYSPGVTATITVPLRNPNTASFTGTLEVSVYRNTTLVQAPTPVAVSLAASGTGSQSVAFAVPASDLRGYLVYAVVKNNSGTVVDTAPGAIDVQVDNLRSKFPRQCWVTAAGLATSASALAASLTAWHCNVAQLYDVYYKPELAPPPGLASWPALDNTLVTRAGITAFITEAHNRAMPALFFQATGEAYSTFLTQATGPTLAMGSFTRACSKQVPCTILDMDRSPDVWGLWTTYVPPWQAGNLVLFDLCNAAWRQDLLTKSIAPMLQQFQFDGWQGDTLGPTTGPRFDINGRPQDSAKCLSDFTSAAQAQLRRPVIVNNVSGFGAVDTALSGAQPYLYRETWNYDTPYFSGLNALVSGGQFGLRRYSSKAIVQPAYLQRTKSDGCGGGTITTGCTVNPVSMKLATAMFAAAGSTLMNHMDDRCMMTAVYVPGYHLPCDTATLDAMLGYKAFEVAYQPMERDGATDSIESCLITGGATGSATGEAGKVYLLGKTKTGHQICYLINLQGLSTTDWTDLNATMPVPTAATSIGMKMYYCCSPVTSGTNKLWWASPDVDSGRAQLLSYTAGSDGGGTYVTFTLPSLAYWDEIVLETNGLADTDLHVNPRDPIRGAQYNDASNGVSASATLATNGCCGTRWVKYAGVAFGGTSPTYVNVTHGNAAAAGLMFRLDSPTGPIIGTCNLPATGGLGTPASDSCLITGATGTRALYAVPTGAPSALYSFVFS